MANYRPKSLDELNSFYDKSLSTQNEIKSSASAISTEAFSEQVITAQSIDDFFAEQADLSAGNCADLTEDIQNFIRDFGKPATAEDEIAIRRRPVPIKLRQTPTQPKPLRFVPDPAEAPVETTDAEPEEKPAPTLAPQEVKPEKTEFVITAEKNELFEEYMRVMSDEDDDDEYSKSRNRKKKKNRKSSEAEEQAFSAVTEEKTEEAFPSLIPDLEPDADSDAESFVSFATDTEQDTSPEKEKVPVSDVDTADTDFTVTSDSDNEEEKFEKQPQKNVAVQLVLIVLLFVTLLSSLAVTSVQMLLKVNSGELFLDKYYVYTADFTDRVTDINEGDLLFVENVPAEDNEVFAYRTAEGTAYAVQTFSGEPERTTGKNSINDNIIVLNTSIMGKVSKIYPSLGKTATVITENFMTVIAGLLVLAIFIILLLIFAFRHTSAKGKTSTKDNFSFDEQEDLDEASDDDFNLG